MKTFVLTSDQLWAVVRGASVLAFAWGVIACALAVAPLVWDYWATMAYGTR